MPYEFRDWHDFDLHIALEVERDHMLAMMDKGKQRGLEVRGIADHDFIHSIYFRDPNGYVIELTSRNANHDEVTDNTRNGAREKLDAWQRARARQPDPLLPPT
jgi:catechol-2,3-dioxygenase